MGILSMGAPSASEYERSLADGFASHPDCQAKASLLRMAISDPLLARDELPPALCEYVDAPPPITAWIPEAVHVALTLAAYDGHARAGQPEPFFDWMAERNRELFASTGLAATVRSKDVHSKDGRERLLESVVAGWGRFHRGTELTVSDIFRGGALVVLRSPPGLYPGIASHVHGVAFRVALEVAGLSEVQVRHVLRRPGVSDYQVSWPDGAE